MKILARKNHLVFPLIAGLVVGLLAMLATVRLTSAAPSNQEGTNAPQTAGQAQTCQDCHLDITHSWKDSAHANAFTDPVFQDRWHALGSQGDCLLCHTTDYQATSGTYAAEGVSCEACHGQVDPNHPTVPAPIRDDAAYCGTCHTTTMSEWRLTGHAASQVGCTDCHDAHSQKALFDDPDQLCVNCHKDSMGPYLEDIHIQKGIGCVDCHALVIPPETQPEDGIVPTGHSFTITPGTCVACHTDALHAGFSLPGYGRDVSADTTGGESAERQPLAIAAHIQSPQEHIQSLETQTQTLQAALASRSLSVLFQGAVVGLVLGGSTAWIVASNVRQRRHEEEQEGSDDRE